LKYCAELIPSDIRSRFATTHILNPNALTHKYLRRLYNVTAGLSSAPNDSFLYLTIISGTPFCAALRVYPSVVELIEHVPDTILPQLVYPGELVFPAHYVLIPFGL